MPSPKSGDAGSAVPPGAPDAVEEADHADPGKVEEIKATQRQTESGKYGSANVPAFKPPKDDDQDKEKKKSWIEIVLVGEDKKPVRGQRYRIILPDQSAAEGCLDENGSARVEGFEAGTCKVTFPDLDQDAWEDA